MALDKRVTVMELSVAPHALTVKLPVPYWLPYLNDNPEWNPEKWSLQSLPTSQC